MRRMHLGQMSAAIVALCLAGVIQHADEVAAMAAGLPEPEETVVPGQVRVDLRHLGVMSRFRIPYVSDGASYPGFMNCAFDSRLRRRVCVSKRGNDSTFGVTMLEHHAKDGTTQRDYDAATTEKAVERTAFVRRFADQSGHTVDLSVRRRLEWAFIGLAADAALLSGVDTTFTIVHRSRGFNRFAQVVSYRDVAFPKHRYDLATAYPTSGVVTATALNEWVASGTTRPFHSSLSVYFDGSRTPEAYLDGKPYRLDLVTGLATPEKAE